MYIDPTQGSRGRRQSTLPCVPGRVPAYLALLLHWQRARVVAWQPGQCFDELGLWLGQTRRGPTEAEPVQQGRSSRSSRPIRRCRHEAGAIGLCGLSLYPRHPGAASRNTVSFRRLLAASRPLASTSIIMRLTSETFPASSF